MAAPIVTGVKEIDKALKAFEPKLGARILKKSFREALKPMKAAVVANAPTGETMRLSKAVKIKTGPRKKGSIELDVQIGAGNFKGETFYGAFVELGTKKITARHFMKKAFESRKESTRELAITGIKAAIEHVTKLLNKKKGNK